MLLYIFYPAVAIDNRTWTHGMKFIWRREKSCGKYRLQKLGREWKEKNKKRDWDRKKEMREGNITSKLKGRF